MELQGPGSVGSFYDFVNLAAGTCITFASSGLFPLLTAQAVVRSWVTGRSHSLGDSIPTNGRSEADPTVARPRSESAITTHTSVLFPVSTRLRELHNLLVRIALSPVSLRRLPSRF